MIEPKPCDRERGPAAGRWRAVLSLGSSCAVAYHLHRLGLADRTGPVDWFGTHDPDHVARLLRSDFDGFMDRRTLSVLGEHNGYWKVGDEANSIFTLHDFPQVGRKPKPLWKPPWRERIRRALDRAVEPAWRWLPWLYFPGADGAKIALPGYPEFRRRMDRRVKRFLTTARDPGPVLFIRRARQGRKEARLIRDAVQDLRGGRPTGLLVIGLGEEYGGDWGLPGIRNAVMPPEDPTRSESWRGSDEAWDRLLRGCERDASA
ncbi:MAG: DUF1796 family putative cysteine peptidase [Thermoanaerobaculales bacterium]|nr:DUF1796 family putative cysteine peptidase [Thermoanaerobaculales bacterium]